MFNEALAWLLQAALSTVGVMAGTVAAVELMAYGVLKAFRLIKL